MAISILKSPPYLSLTANPVEFQILSEVEELRTDVFLNLKIYACLQNEVFKLIGEDTINADHFYSYESYINIDISEYVKTPFSFIEHPYSLTSCFSKKNIVYKFYISVTQSIGNATSNPTYSSICYAMQGGISKKLNDYYIAKGLNWYTDFIVNLKKFLTFCPNYKTVSTESIEFLGFYSKTVVGACLNIKLYFDDGTTHEFVKEAKFLDANHIYMINVGFQFLGLEKYEIDKYIVQYEVYLTVSTDTPISEHKIFVLDRKLYYTKKYIAFKNSFGVYDTFEFKGLVKQINILNKETAFIQNIEKVISSGYQEKFEVNSGFVKKQVKNWLTYLLTSKEVYELTTSNIFPLIIENTEMQHMQSDKFMYDLTIQYKKMVNDYYEPTLSDEGDFNSDFNDDYLI